MGFLDDLGRKVTDAGQKTMQKTRGMSEVARINSLVSREETEVNNLYYQIGKLYVNIHGKDGEEDFHRIGNGHSMQCCFILKCFCANLRYAQSVDFRRNQHGGNISGISGDSGIFVI